MSETKTRPPVAVKREHVERQNDRNVRDPYHWMRDRDDAAVIEHLQAENVYTASVMAPTEALQKKLYGEMLGRIKEDDTSVPVKIDAFLYYTRTEQGKSYAIHCRKAAGVEDAPEEVLLDENELAAGHDFFDLGGFEVSEDHRLLAYATDFDGAERFTLRVKDLATGDLLPDVIPDTYGSVEWANDNRTLYYVKLDEAHRPWQVWRHTLGTDLSADTCVFQDDDPRFFVGVDKTRSKQFILIGAGSKNTDEVHTIDANDPVATPRLIAPRMTGLEYSVDHRGDSFYVLTNHEAQNFRLMRAPVDAPGRESWTEFVGHRDDVLLDDVDVFAGHLVLMQRKGGLTGICIMDLADDGAAGIAHDVTFDEAVYTVGARSNPEFETTLFRFQYSSPVTPPSTFDYDVRTRERVLLKQREVPGGFDPANYRTERLEATAADGARIPISIVYRADRPRDAAGPVLLYGYGAYGICIDPTFDSNRVSLLDRGVAWAIAHIRGGEDLGRAWYDNGKLEHKTNSFTDFIACAEHLIATKWTQPDRLVIRGGSAGGLLLGAVLNMRPDLFRAAVSKVPFVDVVNTMSDPTLPLTVTEYDEWGDMRENKVYERVLGYSPYENITAQDYPAILATGGLNDPRVGFWEPAKWVARLRELRTDDNVLLLKTEMGAGHAGPSGRYGYLEELAFEFAFVVAQLDLEHAGG